MLGTLCGTTRVFGFKPTDDQEVKILPFPAHLGTGISLVGVGSALVYVGNLMFPLWFALLCGSFLSSWTWGPSTLFLVFPPFLGPLVYL
jgi:hypothetical protein